jgi:anthranilate synthase component 1
MNREASPGSTSFILHMAYPEFKEFSRLARSATLVPVVKSVSADLLTPVSAFLSIAENEPHAFLLESVERGEQIGRYTFLGARPYMRLRARGSAVEIERGHRRERRQGNVFQVVKELLGEHQPAAMAGLPPFTAGAVGYFSYAWCGNWKRLASGLRTTCLCPIAN